MAEQPRVIRIGLVACSKKKLGMAAPAEDLYTSNGFKLARRYVLATCSAWAILSAKHGLIMPQTIIEPYDLKLADFSAAALREWGQRVRGEFDFHFSGYAPSQIEIVLMAGRRYRSAFAECSYTISAPLARMGMFRQQAWLRSTLARLGPATK